MVNHVDLFEIEETADFPKDLKRFVKKKRFFSLPDQVKELKEKLEQGKFEGDKMTHQDEPTPYDVYKLRLPNPDANVGKSDGYRIIYMVVTGNRIVVLLTMYYKKEDASVSDTYIRGLIDGYFLHTLPEED